MRCTRNQRVNASLTRAACGRERTTSMPHTRATRVRRSSSAGSRMGKSVHVDPSLIGGHQNFAVRYNWRAKLAMFEMIIRDLATVPQHLETRCTVRVRNGIEDTCIICPENALDDMAI